LSARSSFFIIVIWDIIFFFISKPSLYQLKIVIAFLIQPMIFFLFKGLLIVIIRWLLMLSAAMTTNNQVTV
jgi:hypothetical protein